MITVKGGGKVGGDLILGSCHIGITNWMSMPQDERRSWESTANILGGDSKVEWGLMRPMKKLESVNNY